MSQVLEEVGGRETGQVFALYTMKIAFGTYFCPKWHILFGHPAFSPLENCGGHLFYSSLDFQLFLLGAFNQM